MFQLKKKQQQQQQIIKFLKQAIRKQTKKKLSKFMVIGK